MAHYRMEGNGRVQSEGPGPAFESRLCQSVIWGKLLDFLCLTSVSAAMVGSSHRTHVTEMG